MITKHIDYFVLTDWSISSSYKYIFNETVLNDYLHAFYHLQDKCARSF